MSREERIDALDSLQAFTESILPWTYCRSIDCKMTMPFIFWMISLHFLPGRSAVPLKFKVPENNVVLSTVAVKLVPQITRDYVRMPKSNVEAQVLGPLSVWAISGQKKSSRLSSQRRRSFRWATERKRACTKKQSPKSNLTCFSRSSYLGSN